MLHIQPDEGISLRFGAKIPGAARAAWARSRWISITRIISAPNPSTGYERLFYDCMIGDATLFQRADMVEAGWSVVEPVLDVWKALPARAFPELRGRHLGSEGSRRSDDARRKTVEDRMSRFGTTLGRFLQEEQIKHPDLDPGIGPLLTQMAYASKIIGREVGRAALVGKLGLMGELMPRAIRRRSWTYSAARPCSTRFSSTGLVYAMVSEEIEDLTRAARRGKQRLRGVLRSGGRVVEHRYQRLAGDDFRVLAADSGRFAVGERAAQGVGPDPGGLRDV